MTVIIILKLLFTMPAPVKKCHLPLNPINGIDNPSIFWYCYHRLTDSIPYKYEKINFLETFTISRKKYQRASIIAHCMSISECYLKHFERVGGAPRSSSAWLTFSRSGVNISLLIVSVPRQIVIDSPLTPLLSYFLKIGI